MKRSLAFCLLLLLSSCPRPAGLPLAPLQDAELRIQAGQKSPRDLALAGFAAYLLRSKPDEAAPLFDAAAKAGDVWGLFGRQELARRRLDTREKIVSGLAICERAPAHVLCSVAARAALNGAGESPGLDALIETAALKALAGPVRGDAAYWLRLAAAAVRQNRDDDAGARALWSDAGQVGAASLLGPYSRYHFLEWDTAFPPETGDPRGGTTGPLGSVLPREARAFDGRYAINAEPTTADVYYWATDVLVNEEGRFHLRATGRGSFRVLLDNGLAIEQRDFEAWPAQERVVEVALSRGTHRLVAKVSRGTEHADALWLALSRADGKPARHAFTPAAGPFDGKPPRFDNPDSAFPDASSLAASLEEEVGSALAAFVAARSAQERDEEGSFALADPLAQKQGSSPLLVLRAEALLVSRSVSTRIARGRAHRDLEDALKLDPGEASALQRLSVHARGENRFDEATDLLEKARAVAAPQSWRVLLTEMKLAQARGADAAADGAAQRALAVEPGLCDALELRYDQARRLDAVALADALVKELGRCPGHDARFADHLRLRGDLAGALVRVQKMVEVTPLEPSGLQSAAQLAVDLGRPEEAAAMLERLQKSWPRNALFHKKRADALERAGDAKTARAEREAALLLDGSDLKLRRLLAVQDGREVLDELKADPAPLLKRWEEKHGTEHARTSGVYVLDASAVEAHPDGSFTERTHVLAKVLDQEGVSSLAEVHLPAGAEILSLRTLKADGRVLEPEAIGGKEGMSLPGVEVGDLVEYEYLHATPARGAATPGFAAPKFYFRIADGQLFHSTYSVRARVGSGLFVDPHNMEGAAVRHEGLWDVVTVEREEMPSFVREPGSPALEEVLPWVQVGSGAGLDDVLAGLADFLIDRAKPNAEVARFAREAAGSRVGMEAVKAVYAKVMQEVKGPEASLTTRSTWTLSQGRGCRLVLLKGALSALGIGSRVVLVKPFGTDPATYRFPTGELYAYAALQVKTAEGGEALLSPGIRFAPFGKNAAQAEGQEAAVLPEVGEKPKVFKTGGSREADGKRVVLDLALDKEGTLSGKSEEIYQGLEAAFLKSTLEKLNQDQRKQAIEASITRTFENGSLTDFAIDEKDEPGAPVIIRFSFRAPLFARPDGERLVVPRGLYSIGFARRFLNQFERKTPLMVGNPEKADMEVQLSLPPGLALSGAPQAIKLETPFGRIERTEGSAPGRYSFKESVSLKMARIAPEQYRPFGEFLVAIDQAEQKELVFAKAAAGVAGR